MSEARGEKLKRMRKERGLTIDQVASAIGVTKGFMSLLEKNKSGIRTSRAVELAKFFGVDVAEILNEDSVASGVPEPRWIDYLKNKYNVDRYTLDLCRTLVRNAGLPDSSELETDDEFEKRWDFFYLSVLKFIRNPNYQFFSDPLVRKALKVMGIAGCDNWQEIIARVDELSEDALGSCRNFATGEAWRKYVEGKLSIASHVLKSANVDKLLSQVLSEGAPQGMIGGVAMVFGSVRLYGAIYPGAHKPDGDIPDRKYHFFQDVTGEKRYRKSFPFWHEVARVIIDPGLTLGRGAEYIPDGEDMPPIERLFERVAVRLAFAFDGFVAKVDEMMRGSRVGVEDVIEAKDQVYEDSTIRMAAMAACELSKQPMAYIDSYLRLRKDECDDAGITVAEVDAMRRSEKSRLRVGCVFKNAAAESANFDMRYNLRVGETSPIAEAFRSRSNCSGVDDLSKWDKKYQLSGQVDVVASYAHENSRAFVYLKDK